MKDQADDMPPTELGCFNLARAVMDMKDKHDIDGLRKLAMLDIKCSASRDVHWKCFECPCITRARGGEGGFWISSLGRMTKLAELMRLQGIPDKMVKRKGISDRQLGLMVAF